MPERFVSLRRRALRRVAGVSVVLAVALIALTWLGWHAVLELHARQTERQIRTHYEAKLSDYRNRWLRAAQALRAQIEFLRLDTLPEEQRKARLRAFFIAQQEHQEFSDVAVVDAAGNPILTLGCPVLLQMAQDLSLFQDADAQHAYLQRGCADAKSVYVVTRTPLWLGMQGQGQAFFARPLDVALLRHLAQPQDELYLFSDGRLMAAGAGVGYQVAPPPHAPEMALLRQARRQGKTLELALRLDASQSDDGPLLMVRHRMNPLLSATDLMLLSGVAALLPAALLWWGLGQGLRRHLTRLVALTDGAEAFQQTFQRDAAWTQAYARSLEDPDEIARLGRQLDALMDTAERRHREQAAYVQTMKLLDEVVLELTLDGRIVQVSDAWVLVTGIEADVRGMPLADFLNGEDAPVLEEIIASLVRQDKPQASARLQLRNAKDAELWMELRLARSVESDCLRGVLRDITQTYLQEKRITHMALHDALTGLPNRLLLEDRLKVALRLAARSGHKVALGFIDLDHFKTINDSLGHKTGDALLLALAQRLRHVLRIGDTLARWGGDEFVVLLPELPDTAAAHEVAAKLLAALHTPIIIEEGEFNVTMSAGFALYPDDADNGELLLSHADRAMFYAKAHGRNSIQFYSDMSRKGLGKKEVYIQQRLVAAIREGRIFNHYQPLVDAKSRRVIGVEALARWSEPDLGWVSPATFIPMAENLGMIRELGEQVCRQALQDALQWKPYGVGLSLNLSKRQLFKPYFTEELVKAVTNAGLAPADVTLEITESTALMDVEHSAERLKELREAGFRLSIDDFGTGYSSLSQLHELPVHELKIDLSFVKRIHTPEGRRLVQTIVSLAEGLGLVVVAEGVEDAATADLLAQMQVDVLQGWYCGRPMPAEEVAAWMNVSQA